MAGLLKLHLSLAFLLGVIVAQAKLCSEPSVRREWETLSKTERTAWIDGVKCLNRLPHSSALKVTVDPTLSLIPPVNSNSSFYDDIVYLHMDLNLRIHFTGFFLPWHRAYLWGVEKAMKEKCGYRGVQPYWDWTKGAGDPYHFAILDTDEFSGFGGWGDASKDHQVTTGAFARGFELSYPSKPHIVRREYTLQPFLTGIPPPGIPPDTMINSTFTKANVDYMVNNYVGDYEGFQAYFESFKGPHLSPHIILGGDMSGTCPENAPHCIPGPKWSPNDPLFFMHHAMVDKVWYDWQHKDPENMYAFHGGLVETFNTTLYDEYPNGAPPFLQLNSTIPGDGLLWDYLTIEDTMDTRNGELCYIYA